MHPYSEVFETNLHNEITAGNEALSLIPSEVVISQPPSVVSFHCDGDLDGNLIRLLRTKGYELNYINSGYVVVLNYKKMVNLYITLPPYSPALLELNNELYLRGLDNND